MVFFWKKQSVLQDKWNLTGEKESQPYSRVREKHCKSSEDGENKIRKVLRGYIGLLCGMGTGGVDGVEAVPTLLNEP